MTVEREAGFRPRRAALGALLGLAATGLNAQVPSGQRAGGSIIVPFSAGSLADGISRRLAELFRESSAASFVVENLPGAGGIIAGNQLVKRPRDGRTLLWGHSGMICNTPLLAKSPLEFDPRVDFVPVCIVANTPFVLFAGKDFPANDLKELQQLARRRKDPLTYVGLDVGSANHLAGEELFQRLGIEGLHVPYRNVQQGFIDVSEGTVSLGIYAWNNMSALLKAGKVKVLTTMADRPLAVAPRIPTVASQGFGRFDLQGWFGIFVASGAPDALVEDLERQIRSFVDHRAFADFLVDLGQEPAFRGRQEARRFIEAEVERYRTILRRLNLA